MNDFSYSPFVYEMALVTASLVLAPLLPGIAMAVQSYLVGESVPSIFRVYRELFAAFRRNPVYADTSTYISRIVPSATTAILIMVLFFLPVTSGVDALFAFPGDFILVVMLLAMVRFLAMAAAMDSGQNLAVMGVSRWLSMVTISDPSLYLILLTAVVLTRAPNLSGILFVFNDLNAYAMVPFVLIALSLLIITLFENMQLPFESVTNPYETTHVIYCTRNVHTGYNFGFTLYGSTLKLWIFSWLFAVIAIPHTTSPFADFLLHLPVPLALAATAGVIAALRPQSRLAHLPRFLYAALLTAMLSLVFAVVTMVQGG